MIEKFLKTETIKYANGKTWEAIPKSLTREILNNLDEEKIKKIIFSKVKNGGDIVQYLILDLIDGKFKFSNYETIYHPTIEITKINTRYIKEKYSNCLNSFEEFDNTYKIEYNYRCCFDELIDVEYASPDADFFEIIGKYR